MAFLVQWNCRGLLKNINDIKDILDTVSPVALCVQETNLGCMHSNILKKYQVFRRDREQASRLSGGAAIILQSGVPAQELKLNTPLEAVAATIIAFKTLTVCSVYLEPNLKITLHDLENLFCQLPEPYLVVGDFNAHSPLWGSEKSDTRGQLIEDFILSSDICLLNSCKPTYCSPRSGKMSFLDLAFSSPSLFNDFKWDVLNNPYSSDHLPAIISLSSSPSVMPTKPKRWKLHLADWELFKVEANLGAVFSDALSVDR